VTFSISFTKGRVKTKGFRRASSSGPALISAVKKILKMVLTSIGFWR